VRWLISTLVIGAALSAPALAVAAAPIQGKVTRADSTPIKGAKVIVRRTDGRRAGPFFTDAQGSYSTATLPAGQWSVWFGSPNSNYLDEYHQDSTTLAGSTPVTVANQPVTVNASLERAAHIAGLVTDEARGSIGSVTVIVFNNFDQVVASTVTAPNGQYRIGRLRTGLYRVAFEPMPDSGFVAEFYDDKSTLADATGIWLLAGSTAPAIDAELATELSPG